MTATRGQYCFVITVYYAIKVGITQSLNGFVSE